MPYTVSSAAQASTYRVIGLMSGSSLDGLDMACCEFTQTAEGWRFAILAGACADYSAEWADRLRHAYTLSGKDLWQLHADFGRFSGEAVAHFINDHALQDVTCVASHGHTVFHFPQQAFTTQIGCGAALAHHAGLPAICDFRSGDVAKGGQGAPLVPIGDLHLFHPFKFLLNLGGIANLTIKYHNQVAAFDICCANQILNHYAQQAGQPFDRDGMMAAGGKLDQALLDALNALEYYARPYPKSLDNGFSRNVVLPLMEKSDASLADKLHTYCDHVAYQISRYIKITDVTVQDSLLATGGGALNKHLMRRLTHYLPVAIAPVDQNIIQYKEALIFAFMGLLRWQGVPNTVPGVTGATQSVSGGAIYLP